MENKLHHTINDKKTPALEDRYSLDLPDAMENQTTLEIIANSTENAIEIETPFGTAHFSSVLSDGSDVFPSLSKGTLNRTFTENIPKYAQTQQTNKHLKSDISNATQKPQKLTDTLYSRYTLYTKSAKVYPDKVIINKFKRVIARSTGDIPPPARANPKKQTPEEAEHSRERSIARTRRTIFDLVQSNDFQFFGTLTFDPKKHPECRDREWAVKQFTQYMNNQKKINGDFKYLAIPETMKDGKIHFHVLLGGYKGKLTPTKLVQRSKKMIQRYKMPLWEKKFGFADFEDIGSKEHLGLYITKYITKEITSSSINADAKKRYMASRNLTRPRQIIGDDEVEKLLSSGEYSKIPANSYENEHLEQLTFEKL